VVEDRRCRLPIGIAFGQGEGDRSPPDVQVGSARELQRGQRGPAAGRSSGSRSSASAATVPAWQGFHDRQVRDRDVARRRSAGSATESWTPTGRAGARTSRWPTDPARGALDRGAHAGPPQGHQQGDAVRREMHLEPLEVRRPIRRDRAPGRADRGDSRPCRECDNNPYVKSESERAQIIESATWSSRSSPVRLPTRSTPPVPPTTWSRCSRPSLAVDAGPDGPPPPPTRAQDTGMGEG